jgi:hypothetical protein
MEYSSGVSFGIPIPALRARVGEHIQSGRVGVVPSSLMPTDTAFLRDGHIQRNHNGICSTISGRLREARCPHLGAGTQCTCKGIFRNDFPRVTDETAMKNINGILSKSSSSSVISRVTSIHSLDVTIRPTQRS